MEIYSYCYTRGLEPDYRDFVNAPNLPMSVLAKIRSMIKPIIEENLSTPRWVLIKEDNIIVWGICCMNELLSIKNYSDIKGRKVKGFFSLVLSDFDGEDVYVPYSVEFFQKLYQKEVEPCWECHEGSSHRSSKVYSYSDIQDVIYASNESGIIDLNSSPFLCKALGDVNVKKAVATALCHKNVSLITGCQSFSESYKAEENFLNCITLDSREELHAVQKKCPKCGKKVSFFTEHGVCYECDKQIFNIENTGVISTMEQSQYKKLERENRDLAFKLNELLKKSKTTDRKLKVMTIICGILLIALLLLLLGKINKKNTGSEFFSYNSIDTIYVSQDTQYDFKLMSKQLRVPSDGKESVTIMWKSNIPRINYSIGGQEWVSIRSKDDNRLILDVSKNTTLQERTAKVVFQLGEKTDTVFLIQDL